MRQTSNRNTRPYARLSLMLISVASLTACASLLEEFKSAEAARNDLLPKVASGNRLPDLPASIKTCLMKEACRQDAAKAKASKQPAPQCTTADGIVLAYMQTDEEKRKCTGELARWWKEQQKIQDAASGMKKDAHPRSGKQAKVPDWP